MLDELFTSVSTGDITLGTFLLCIACAFVCGIIIALASSFRTEISRSLIVAELLIPAIVAVVIIMVNGSIGTGIAVAGAFSLIRFRSAPGKAKDIVLLFLSTTAGIACAAGYVAIAILFTVIVCAVIMVLTFLPLEDGRSMDLKITIPENLNFNGVFDGLLAKYTKKHRLVSVKTSNMGSMYKLSYKIEMKDPSKIQELIDEVRTRNANLEVSVTDGEFADRIDVL